MALVTFNEHVNGHVKGDVVDLSKDELKAIDAYAELHEIEKPYTKGEHEVSNTSDALGLVDQARENSLATGDVEKSEPATDDVEDADDEETATTDTVEESDADATDEAQELPEATDEPATDEGSKPKVVKK